ncbi:iron-sulfur protein [Spirochaetia bacterium]|nr:iron-sulfur protein [Spirochaetia bacterium]
MNENIIFFFSGTGNSFDIALRLAEQIKNTDVLNIASVKSVPPLENYKRIGVIFPVYGFTMPNIVLKFISKIPQNNNVYYFSIATLGAFALGAMYRTYEAFKKAGIELKYITNIYMPENYILFSKVPSDKIIWAHLKNSVKRIKEISDDILNYKKKKATKTILYNMVKNISLEESKKWPLTAKKFIVNKECVKCKKCIRICPVENIKMVNGQIIFDEHCECCLACIHSCSKEAINYEMSTVGKKRYINPNINIEEIKKYC